MKKGFSFLICLVVCCGTFVLCGCSVVSVQSQMFVYESCKVKYVGNLEQSTVQCAKEKQKLLESFKDLELSFTKEGKLVLLNNKQICYLEGGTQNALSLTAKENQLESSGLKVNILNDVVELNFCGGSGEWLADYSYTVTFVKRQNCWDIFKMS